MQVNTAIIGIGSNIDPERHIGAALAILGEYVTVCQQSEMVRTAPIGITDQPDFVNGAVKITTHLTEAELRRLLRQIEDQLGRDRTLPKFGPRTIDLDLVVWNKVIVDPDYHSRPFLQKSVDELAG